MKKALRFFPVFFLLWLCYGCATVGSPVGGYTDKEPPVPVKYSIPNGSVNFSGKKIEVTFNEIIVLKDLRKTLMVSPPLEIVGDIKPSATPSRKLVIDLSKQELEQNTTYTFNFGDAVADNNEGNMIQNFQFVFSTGDKLDSLTLGGVVSDAIGEKFPTETVLMLYKLDSLYNDSLVFKARPSYFTRLVDKKDSTFVFRNVKEGSYKLIALEDKNGNMVYDPNAEMLGFFPRAINLPEADTVGYRIRMSLKPADLRVYQAVNRAHGLVVIPVQGAKKGDTLERIYPEFIQSDSTFQFSVFDEKLDSVRYFYTPAGEDSLKFIYKSGDRVDTIKANLRKNIAKRPFELKMTGSSSFGLKDTAVFAASKPVFAYDKDSISLTDKDTLEVPFSLAWDEKDPRSFRLLFSPAENQKYSLTFLPGAFKSYMGEPFADTLKINLVTKAAKDYGTIKINVNSFGGGTPMIVELLNQAKNQVVKSRILKDEREFEWTLLTPGTYYIRIIFDQNGNGKYDPGNILRNEQPEKVYYFPDKLELQANWVLEQEI